MRCWCAKKWASSSRTAAGKFFENAQIERGGVKVETSNSQIDATLATRWQHIVAALGQDNRGYSNNTHHQTWLNALHDCTETVRQCNVLQVSGRLTRVTGMVMEAVGLRMPVGSTCVIELPHNRIEAEVVGFAGDKLFLMPETDVQGLVPAHA